MPLFKVKFTKDYHLEEDHYDIIEVCGHALIEAANKKEATKIALTYSRKTPNIVWEEAKEGQEYNPETLKEEGYVYTDFTFSVDENYTRRVRKDTTLE